MSKNSSSQSLLFLINAKVVREPKIATGIRANAPKLIDALSSF